MRELERKRTAGFLIGCSLVCAAASTGSACNSDSSDPSVNYGMSTPVGRWDTQSAQAKLGDTSVEIAMHNELPAAGRAATSAGSTTTVGPTTTPTGQTGTQSGANKANTGAAGRDSSMNMPAATGGAAGGSNKGMTAAAGSGDKPMADKPAADNKSTTVSGLTFNFTTEPVGGRYKPKNIGAVWISDSSGKLIKSLEVWAYLRLRYLTKYASVRGAARPDVTASATLPNHSKPHMATWDLKDTTGAMVAPGKYTLNAEITDQDATGKSMSVDFDLSAGAMMLMPPNSTGFTQMQLVLK